MSARAAHAALGHRRAVFFVALALVMLAVVAVGFGPTLYLRTAFGTTDRFTGSLRLPPHLLVHGLVLTAWFTLFVAQTWLVSAGRTTVHRRLGFAGVAVAAAVVASSAYTMHRVLPRALAALSPGSSGAEAVPRPMLERATEVIVGDFWVLVVFVLFVGAAVYLRQRPAAHKRLMFLGSAMLIGPALSVARPVGATLVPYLPAGLRPSLLFLALCIAALVWHDLATKRRLEPATVWGTAAIAVAVAIETAMARGEVGLVLTRWVAGLPP